jgi:hypothetical protein
MALVQDWPNKKTRELVQTLIGVGLPLEQVCLLVSDEQQHKPMTLERLTELFPNEIKTAHISAKAKVLGNLFKLATGNGKDALRASQSWLAANAVDAPKAPVEQRIKEALLLSERLMSRDYE